MDNETTVSSYRKQALKNEKESTTYGGKRFLGFTPKGAEVWVSMSIDRDTLDLKIESTHDFNTLLKEGARLASKRITLKRGEQSNATAEDLLRRNQKNQGGEVKVNTLRHIQRLMNAADMKYKNAYQKGKPTSLFFTYVANAIFDGSFNMERGDTSWNFILNEWDFPREGEYFTVMSIPLFEGQCEEPIVEEEDDLESLDLVL